MTTPMQCAAKAVRSNERCKNIGTVELAPGVWACDIEAHRANAAKAAGAPTSPPAPTAPGPAGDPSPAPSPPTANGGAPDAAAAAALDSLPPDGSDLASEIVDAMAAAPEAGDSLADLEREAKRMLDGLPADPAAADRAARERTESAEGAVRRDAGRIIEAGGRFTEKRVRFYLFLVVSGPLVAGGKEGLTKEELDEGAELGAAVLNDLFHGKINNPYVALGAWGVMVVGSRYFGDLTQIVLGLVKWIGATIAARFRKLTGKPSAPAAPAAPPPAAARAQPTEADVDSLAGRGWAPSK